MGLDITARIVTKSSIEMEKQYNIENWPKVKSGEMRLDEYYYHFPVNNTFRTINVSEFGIRNFWGLRKFFIETLGIDNDSVFMLDKEQIQTTFNAAKSYSIPNIDDYSYNSKCDETAAVCERAMQECDFANEIVEFFFSH